MFDGKASNGIRHGKTQINRNATTAFFIEF
jgi:hypothetical protein